MIKAIHDDQLLGFPWLIFEAAIKHLPESKATVKGHIHKEPKNIGSTSKPKTTIQKVVSGLNQALDMIPILDPKSHSW